MSKICIHCNGKLGFFSSFGFTKYDDKETEYFHTDCGRNNKYQEKSDLLKKSKKALLEGRLE